MEKTKNGSGKASKIIYWIATIWLASGMLASGAQQLLKLKMEGAVSPPGVEGIARLGFPVYFLTIIGIWKILGVIALLAPRSALIKEWAYAGYFFLTSGAIYTHIAMGHSFAEIFPSLLLLILTVVSWYFRPASRKIVAVAY
ncbi:DoxX family protein [Longitalea luteola]|uniref:DoxX family protein n=1 Tax=Longitalea luteola TaxID=2812563 RepID=UPI001A958A23|nr:DoxX family protein [Longitalea luteola]